MLVGKAVVIEAEANRFQSIVVENVLQLETEKKRNQSRSLHSHQDRTLEARGSIPLSSTKCEGVLRLAGPLSSSGPFAERNFGISFRDIHGI